MYMIRRTAEVVSRGSHRQKTPQVTLPQRAPSMMVTAKNNTPISAAEDPSRSQNSVRFQR